MSLSVNSSSLSNVSGSSLFLFSVQTQPYPCFNMGSEEVSPVRHSWFLYSSRVVKCTKRARPSWRRLPKLCKDVRLVVPHQRLISKVDYCGIRGNLKLWIKDFLNHDWSPAACSRWWFVLQLVSAHIWRTTRKCIGSNKVPHVTYNVKRVSVRTSLFVAARFTLRQP